MRWRYINKNLALPFILIYLFLSYQNCSNSFDVKSSLLDQKEQANSSSDPEIIIINNIPDIVNTPTVTIDFKTSINSGKISSTLCQINSNPSENCQSGSITFSNLSDNDYNISITVTAMSGRLGQWRKVFRKDSTPPVITVSTTPPSISSLSTADFSFTVTDNLSGVAKIECALDNQTFSNCTSPLKLTNLSIGSHRQQIRATDKANNLSQIYSYSWTVDTSAPTVTFSTTPHPFTNKTTATLSFVGTNIVSYECQIDSDTYSSCTSPQNYSNLSAGSHTFRVMGVTSNGTKSSPLQYIWTIDLIAPTPPNIMSNVPSVTNAKNVSFVFSSSDESSGISNYQCSTDSSAFTDCSSPYTLTALTEGTHLFKVKSTDNAGNTSPESSFNWLIDASSPPPAPVSDLCNGFIKDKLAHPLIEVAKPGYLSSIQDPVFGSKIRRITNSTTGQIIKTAYATIPAFNIDESLIMLWQQSQGHLLLDGKTYQFIKYLNIDPNDIEQVHWDPVDKNTLYYPKGTSYYKHDVTTNTSTLLRNFSQAPTSCSGSVSYGDDPQYMSWGSEKVVGLLCGKTKFIYSLSTNQVLGQASLSGTLAPVVGPTGTLAILNSIVYNTSFTSLRTLDIYSFDEHASIGKNASGQDVYNMSSYDGNYVGTLVSYNMVSGAASVLIGPDKGYPYPPSGTHVSSLAIKNPGWVVTSTVGNVSGKGVLDQELDLANVDSGVVCRLAHHRSYGKEGSVGYFAEPHPVLSPSGTRILFSSDWRNSGSVDTYVIELPSYQ